ncbi:MAG TPA: hypothetical protein VN436_07735 [Holophaga sp.]|nr:hypothetical protein [Holophaga sp.]
MSRILSWFFRALVRAAVVAAGFFVLWLGWRAFLRFGPKGPQAPAMYAFQAKGLVSRHMAFPRPAAPVLLPVPATMSSADVQLRLMKWWDGRHWLSEALAHGEPVKGGLRLRSGTLALVEVVHVSPSVPKGDATVCQVRARVRWEAPAGLEELFRVREIVGLRAAKGLLPGQSAELVCTFTQKGWRWELTSVQAPWAGELPLATPGLDPVDLVF